MRRLPSALALSALLLPTLAFAGEPSAADASDKLICKRFAETGSFVKKRRVCLTERQWREVAENAQDRGREMQMLPSTEHEIPTDITPFPGG